MQLLAPGSIIVLFIPLSEQAIGLGKLEGH
jgi:hypothetical protein